MNLFKLLKNWTQSLHITTVELEKRISSEGLLIRTETAKFMNDIDEDLKKFELRIAMLEKTQVDNLTK